MRNIRWIVSAVLIASVCGCGQNRSGPSTNSADAPITAVSPAMMATDSPATQHTDAGAPAPTTTASLDYSKEKYRLVNEPDEIVSVLDNGATVIVKRLPSPVIAMRAYVHTGGLYEGRWLGGGLSHLLEHLVAGGSCARRTEAQNLDLLQKIGNNSDAFTDFDMTAFFVNTTTDHAEQAVDLVTGWVLGASITPAEFHREREVVQRELEKDAGESDWAFYNLVQLNRYYLSPARVPVIGYQPVIKKLTRDDVYSYFKQAYVPNNMIFSLVGDLPPEAMLKLVRQYVKDAPPGRAFDYNVTAEPPVLSPRTLVATFPKLGGAKLALAFPSVKLTDSDMYPLDLLTTILGTGDASMMVEDLRDDKQLVTSIEAGDNTPEYVTGTFEIDMDLDDASKIDAAKKEALALIEQVKDHPIDADRIARAKTQLRNSQVFGRQTSEDVASQLAQDFLQTHDAHFSQRYVDHIEAVTPEQLQAAAKKYFTRDRLMTTALLDEDAVGAQGLPKAEALLRPVAPTTQPESTQPAEQVVRSVLSNGTVLLVKRMTTTPAVVIRLYGLGGVSVEDAKTNGLGNLSMQMLQRGAGKLSAQQIAEQIDSLGASLDFSCGNNSWSWSATCLNTDLPRTLDLMNSLVQHPSFPADQFEPTRQRVLASISADDADWSAQAMRFFKQAYFGPSHSPYQFLPVGSAANVKQFTRDQVNDWYQQKVLKAPRVLAIFGDVDAETARNLAEKTLGTGDRLPAPPTLQPEAAATNPSESADTGPAKITVARVVTNKTDNPEAGIVIGFSDQSVIGEQDTAALDMAHTLTGGWTYPTGYLFEILRGQGLVYDVEAYNNPGRNSSLPGVFVVYAGCEPSNVNTVVSQILQNVARLQGSAADIQPNWFNRAKQLMITSEAIDNETPAAQAEQAAIDELLGLGWDYHLKFADRVNNTTLSDVQSVAHRRLSTAVITVSTPDLPTLSLPRGTITYSSLPPVTLTPGGVQHDTGSGSR